jgi:hypothetical protein
MLMSRWLLAALSALALGLASPVLAQFCALDPISPLCCPSPCPVVDTTRVPKLLSNVETLGDAIGIDAQVIQATAQLGQSIGEAGNVASAVGGQLSSFAGALSNQATVLQTGAANPARALAGVKQSLFEPVGITSTGTQVSTRRAARMAAAQREQVAAFAVSLTRSKTLSALASRQSQIAGMAAGTEQLQGDMAANSASRLALYQDVGAIHQLLAAWVAQRSMQAALAHPSAAGDTTAPSPPPPATGDNAPPPPASADQAMAGAVDRLVILHDARVAAQTLLSAYPGLQQTIASANLADQFAIQAESALRQSLSNAGLSTIPLADIENTLATLDTTGWLDSVKASAAQQAVSKVSAAILAGSGLSQNNDGGAAVQQVQAAMAAWLDANKQRIYWADLASQAKQSISVLDAGLGALSDRAGIDVSGAAGAAQEKILLAQLSRSMGTTPWKPVLAAAVQDPLARSVLNYAGAR